jgi:hypothetical protein
MTHKHCPPIKMGKNIKYQEYKVLKRILIAVISHTLLMKMQNDTVPPEDSLAVFHKVKNTLIL